MKVIKVLLISHNPFSTYQSMGKTFASLFSEFEKKEVCQLYVYPSFPNIDMANSYYRITDMDAMKNIFPFRQEGGTVNTHEYAGGMIEDSKNAKYYAQKSNNMPLKRLIRDAVWKMSHWYSKKVKQWIDKEAPDCIFLAPGYAKFIYDIALKIAKVKKIPIITYICDDYYFLTPPKNLIGKYQQWLLRAKICRVMRKTKLLIAISEEIACLYSKEFKVKTQLIMTGSNFETCGEVTQKVTARSLSYFGNMGINRDKSLADIGMALDEINDKNNTDYRLKIYTNLNGSYVPSIFKEIRSVEFCGFLVGEEFEREFMNADCLVHVEAFDSDSIDLVKGSISTKIADSLVSGIPLLAYCPSGVASVEHLRRNQCAFIANNYEGLQSALRDILQDRSEERRVGKECYS